MGIYKFYNHIDAYIEPKNIEDWKECPNCGLKPHIWEFDNGRSTACGCWVDKYQHFSIHAESVMSIYHNSKDKVYRSDELNYNWNHYCSTGEILFEHASKRTDGRW